MDAIAQAGAARQPAGPLAADARLAGNAGRAGILVPLLLAVAFFVLLATFAGVDPARGVTASTSPFTDEGWNVLNARNFVLFGRWATDGWAMDMVNYPFSLSWRRPGLPWPASGSCRPGCSSSRLGLIAVGALGLGLRRPLGGLGASLAAAALGGSALLLYYGRLAYLEPLVMLWLILALLALTRERPSYVGGVVAGVAIALAIATKASAGAAAGRDARRLRAGGVV